MEIETAAVEIKVGIKIPGVPSLLRFEDATIPIESLSEEALRAVGQLWTQNLVQKAREKRKGDPK